MIVNDSKKSPKVAKNFCCNYCYYFTSKKSDYEKHLSTIKHQKAENDSKMVGNDSEKSPKVASMYYCSCGKAYKYDSGYYRHKKNCKIEKEVASQHKPSLNFITPELIMELIKDNKDMKQIILEQNSTILEQNSTINSLVKNGITNTNTNSLNNNNNKTFNLQFFLNETCKDAMNIMDFVDSIKLQLSDLEKVGEVGYTQGISNIITTNLKALDVTQRPVHCTDKKRETMYIKDEDKWEKEDDNNTKLRKAIKRIANKNITLLPKFREKYPDYSNSSSKISDKYDHIVVEAMGGVGNNDIEKEDKIIHNISKCVIIDK